MHITCRTNMMGDNDRDLFAVINVVHTLSVGESCVCLWQPIHTVCGCCALLNFFFKGLLCRSADNWILFDKRLQRSSETTAKWGSQFFHTQLDHDQLSPDWALINQSLLFQSIFTPKDKNRCPIYGIHDKFITNLLWPSFAWKFLVSNSIWIQRYTVEENLL